MADAQQIDTIEGIDQSNIELPVVTVFGAGVAGLSAAHEMIERGFRVQVVEPKQSPTREYECAVGGLAANQFTRVRASLQVLQHWLMADDQKTNLAYALAFRDWQSDIEPAATRFPINQKLRFDKKTHRPAEAPPQFNYQPPPRSRYEPKADVPIPDDWRDYWDAHGVSNKKKLDAVFDSIRAASQAYMLRYFPKLAEVLALGVEPKPDEWSKYTTISDTAGHARRFIARETFSVRIVGYTDSDETDEANRFIAKRWATAVLVELLRRNADARKNPVAGRPPIWELKRRLEVVVRGSAGARRDGIGPRARSLENRVEFEVVEQIIPGEHGFRFFPGFYRHLFDTMKRTTFVDAEGVITGTAYDQLVATPHPQLALNGGLNDFDFRKIGSLTKLRAAKTLLIDKLGIKPNDVMRLQFKTLRYLLSGPKRRRSEAEPINLIDYLGGEKAFTSQCLDFIDRAPRALAAMSARESDARTQFDISLQLLLPGLPDPMTLNGPTSLVWLDLWKDYLRRQGVNFFVGEIVGFKMVKGEGKIPSRLVPEVRGPEIGREPALHPVPEDTDDVYLETCEAVHLDQHRYVLATQFQNASELAWKARKEALDNKLKFEGPFAQIVAFDELAGRRKARDTAPRQPERDPATGKEPLTWPVRTISGLQFFFPQAYRFGQSNVYFGFSEYGLTSISQYAYWRRHTQAVGQLLGQISIDIGDWHAPYPKPDAAGKIAAGPPAFYASAKEIAGNTWSQVKTGLSKNYANAIQQPQYFHIDQNMVFTTTGPSTTGPSANSPAEKGWRTAGAVRANAIVRVPYEKNDNAIFALTVNRTYMLELQVGLDGMLVSVDVKAAEALPLDVWTLRGRLLEALQDKGKVEARTLVAPSGDYDILISPVVTLSCATLRVTRKSDAAFTIRVGERNCDAPVEFSAADREINVFAKGCEPEAAAAEIARALAMQAGDLVCVTPVGPNALKLTPKAADKKIALAVLNTDRGIELVDAPTLIVSAFNLMLIEPEEGFALLRNDYEYLINIPDQWQGRPGLRRADYKSVPKEFWDFARNFGVNNPEICYLTPASAPALQYWFGAGTYMATYTRMTTMEAAAESGRHAAAAIIFDLFHTARINHVKHYGGLAGDLPAIFPVEDNEFEDLSFFTALDDQLYDSGLPHLFDILGLTRTVEALLGGQGALEALRAQILTGLKLSPNAGLLPPDVSVALLRVFAKFFGDALGKSA